MRLKKNLFLYFFPSEKLMAIKKQRHDELLHGEIFLRFKQKNKKTGNNECGFIHYFHQTRRFPLDLSRRSTASHAQISSPENKKPFISSHPAPGLCPDQP